MAIPIGTFNLVRRQSQALATRARAMTSDQAAELLRQSKAVYRAVITRPDARRERLAVAAAGTIQAAQAADRHTLTIRNTGAVDLRIGHTEEEAEGSDYMELNVGEIKKFDIHYSGLEPVRNTGIYKQIFHCEWSDDLFINNPDALNAGEIEIFEVY